MRYSIPRRIIPIFMVLGLFPDGRAQSIGRNAGEEKNDSPSTSIISNPVIDDRDPKDISAAAAYSKKPVGESSFFGIGEIAEEAKISKSAYIATIDIGRMILGADEAKQSWVDREGITVGVKRPYYKIGSDTRLRGLIDLRFSHALAAVNSSLVVSFKYDFRKRGSDRAFRSEIGMADIAYKIIIPFYLP